MGIREEQLEELESVLGESHLKQLNVRLPSTVHLILGHVAAEKGLSIPKLVEGLITDYAIGAAAEARDVAQKQSAELIRQTEVFGRVVELALHSDSGNPDEAQQIEQGAETGT